jgi:serine/threonine protein kinase
VTVLRIDDDSLGALRGQGIASLYLRGVHYRVDRVLGEGGMGVALFALRVSPEGVTPVVLKVLRPSFVVGAGPTAALTVQKEAVALGRLNERVPPTPFVVRMLDAGAVAVDYRGQPLELPWLALEYVQGGAEGTTLTARVAHAVRTTRYAFGPERAARAIESLALGVGAVHEMGVVHRDIKPDNILCCGSGEREIFKVSDFGLARPAGVAGTFAGLIIGTPGFAPPELTALDQRRTGTWTDVFACAAVAYFILTGEEYFLAPTPAAALALARAEPRRSIRECARLHPELAARDDACRAIDLALARASTPRFEERTQTAALLAASLMPTLRVESRPPRVSTRRDEWNDQTMLGAWSWMVRWQPSAELGNVRFASWDGDGRCLASATRGLIFWTGTEWRQAPYDGDPRAIRFVKCVGSGRWVVGAGDVRLYAQGGVHLVWPADSVASFDLFDGVLDDLAVVGGQGPGGVAMLRTWIGRRWLRPLPLPDVAQLSSLSRVDDERWLVTGDARSGGAFAAIASPLGFQFERLETQDARSLSSSAGRVEHGVGCAAGAAGAALWWERGTSAVEGVGNKDLTAVAVDQNGRGVVAASGKIWLRRGGVRENPWSSVWDDATSRRPIVSLFADADRIVAVTNDAGMIEGRPGSLAAGRPVEDFDDLTVSKEREVAQ